MEVGLVILVVIGLACAVCALARDRRADYEEPVRLESPGVSRAPGAVEKSRRQRR